MHSLHCHTLSARSDLLPPSGNALFSFAFELHQRALKVACAFVNYFGVSGEVASSDQLEKTSAGSVAKSTATRLCTLPGGCFLLRCFAHSSSLKLQRALNHLPAFLEARSTKHCTKAATEKIPRDFGTTSSVSVILSSVSFPAWLLSLFELLRSPSYSKSLTARYC